MTGTYPARRTMDPMQFVELCWPDIYLYNKQREILYSLVESDETVVPAGNMLGKDFIAALGCLYFFMSRHPCRVVTTSVDENQLSKVLWGEINNFIAMSKQAFPFVVNHMDIKKVVNGKTCPKSYLLGRVASRDNQGAGLLGHHLALGAGGEPRTLAVQDEASGMLDIFNDKIDTWAHRKLLIGNPYPCENHFRRASTDGNLLAEGGRVYRRVIRIRGIDSPNVRLGLAQKARGETPTDEVIVPGLLTYGEYVKRRETWDVIRQTISLDAEFYTGGNVYLFPNSILEAAERFAAGLNPNRSSLRRCMGVDSAMGGDNTTWAICDDLGLLALISRKTPNTSDIVKQTLSLMVRYGIPPENVLFDAGGGGQVHADNMRDKGYAVRSVAFGESVTPPIKTGLATVSQRREQREERYAYKNRRAELYGELAKRLEPLDDGTVQWGLPAALLRQRRLDDGPSLRKQLEVIPLWYDEEGRLFLPPKQHRGGDKTKNKVTINSLLGGFSPDEADALVLAHYGLISKSNANIGVVF